MAELDRQRGERIAELRLAIPLTQRQLADRLQVDPKTVHNWEAGKDLNPTNLADLAKELQVTVDYIRNGERGETPDLLGAGETQLDRIEDAIGAIQIQLAELVAALADQAPPKTRGQSSRKSGASAKKRAAS